MIRAPETPQNPKCEILFCLFEALLPTFSVESEVRFASAKQRSAFAEELTELVAQLVAKYHDDSAAGGRRFRLVVGAYPKPKTPSRTGSRKTRSR